MSISKTTSWKPDRPTSRGARAYHEAVMHSSWSNDCLDQLISISEPYIKDNEIVADFGAGTGISALRFLDKFKMKIKLWLIDNSPAWLGNAYEILGKKPNVSFFILDKKDDGYATLAETTGRESLHHVLSANTFHLVPKLKETFRGIADALKPKGKFIFNSANIERDGTPNGAVLLDSTVFRVHDKALEIVNTEQKYKRYRQGLSERIKLAMPQRKFIFPDPRDIQVYLKGLKDAGFEYIKPYYKSIKIKYSDWLNFYRVKRLQAGILPEIGGKNPNEDDEKVRDSLITQAAHKIFKEMEINNPLADKESFHGEWTYITATKST